MLVFKTAWSAKVAKKAGIADEELCRAFDEIRKGQADHLGGGVVKKRIEKNQYRGIVLVKSPRYWVYEYLFAKKDRENIDSAELNGFRKLAKAYAMLSAEQLAVLEQSKDLVEICGAGEA